jgi:hypothetical protein
MYFVVILLDTKYHILGGRNVKCLNAPERGGLVKVGGEFISLEKDKETWAMADHIHLRLVTSEGFLMSNKD